MRLQQEQQRVSMERQRSASLNAQNHDLQNELLAMSAKVAGEFQTPMSLSLSRVFFSWEDVSLSM